jgi:hypothetical protein
MRQALIYKLQQLKFCLCYKLLYISHNIHTYIHTTLQVSKSVLIVHMWSCPIMHNKKQSTGKEDSASFINRTKIHAHLIGLNSFFMLTFLNNCSQLHSLFKCETESKVKTCNIILFTIYTSFWEELLPDVLFFFNNAHLYIGVLYHNTAFVCVTLNTGIYFNPADSN